MTLYFNIKTYPYLMQRMVISFQVDMMSECGNILYLVHFLINENKSNFSPCYKTRINSSKYIAHI